MVCNSFVPNGHGNLAKTFQATLNIERYTTLARTPEAWTSNQQHDRECILISVISACAAKSDAEDVDSEERGLLHTLNRTLYRRPSDALWNRTLHNRSKMKINLSGVAKRVVFQKGGFGGCSPGTKTGARVHSDVPPEQKPERGYVRMFPRNENRNEGTFAKTTLLRNCLLSPTELNHTPKETTCDKSSQRSL